jgi:MraZ protein
MFLGRYQHSLDTKGRVAIPARYRDEFADGVVITRGIDRCLSVYPMATWLPLAAKVDALPITDPDARTFRRLVFAEAANLDLDSQGRILIPPELRRYANLAHDVYVVGVNTSLEIWNPELWASETAIIDHDGAAIAQRLASLI